MVASFPKRQGSALDRVVVAFGAAAREDQFHWPAAIISVMTKEETRTAESRFLRRIVFGPLMETPFGKKPKGQAMNAMRKDSALLQSVPEMVQWG